MTAQEKDAGVGRRAVPPDAGMLSIGALARATGIAVDTLRTWERRYGYPVPSRKPSGHRVYPVASVPRLRRIGEALARGHRAGEVVSASDAALAALLRVSALVPGAASPAAPAGAAGGEALLDAVARFDAEGLTRLLGVEWGRLGPLRFVRERVGPLLHDVGDAWAAGRLEVRHEHFLAERVGDLLRAFRLPFEDRARGPVVVCATLPDELHGLGLQMAALVLATVGWRVCYLGTDVPVPQIGTLARDLAARATAVSVSAAARGRRSAVQIARLRALLPRRTLLVVGGEGAPPARRGVEVIRDLEVLHAWGRQLADEGGE